MHIIHAWVRAPLINSALLILIIAGATRAQSPPTIGKRVDLGILELDALNEASGIAASRMNHNVLWIHNDSGDRNVIYAINTRAKHLGVYEIVGAVGDDWEDIAVGPGPAAGRQYIYIGDIGDNDAENRVRYIYRVLEPRVRENQPPAHIKLYGTEKITILYPDGPRDAETLMVDPLTKDIYIVSKREKQVGVYRAAYPQLTTQPITLEKVATLSASWVVAGDISPDGSEILLKTYDAIFYWARRPGQKLWAAFRAEPEWLPYFLEPQGEAIAWKADGMGYYTVSEEYKRIPAHLYFYPRVPAR